MCSARSVRPFRHHEIWAAKGAQRHSSPAVRGLTCSGRTVPSKSRSAIITIRIGGTIPTDADDRGHPLGDHLMRGDCKSCCRELQFLQQKVLKIDSAPARSQAVHSLGARECTACARAGAESLVVPSGRKSAARAVLERGFNYS